MKKENTDLISLIGKKCIFKNIHGDEIDGYLTGITLEGGIKNGNNDVIFPYSHIFPKEPLYSDSIDNVFPIIKEWRVFI